ncbi:MAG: hypothetical protein Q8O19_05260, partial [Rectinemataceae bacterium]|nr:hypothetical protein [Rectinemataceae bacterium]
IRRGAITYLSQLVAAGRLQPSILPLMARHVTATPILPDKTVRYMADVVATALSVGLQHVTALL